MKLLVVHNGWIALDRGKYFLGSHLSAFLHQCAEQFDSVSCMASSPQRPHRGDVLDTSRVKPVPVPMRGTGRFAKLFSYCRNLGVIFRTVRESDFLYVFFPGNISLLAVFAARLLRRPYGIYLRGEIGKDSFLWRWTMSNAKFVIATGGVLADAAARYCSDVEQAVPICPLPAEVESKSKPFRAEGPWRLLYVGTLVEEKGIKDLLEAALLLRKRGVAFCLDLVGQNAMDGLPEYVEQLDGYVNLAGPVYESGRLRQYYRDADLFCFASHNEGFPRVLYEAMAHGVPIVTTFVGSISSLMEDETNCLRFDVRSPNQLADTVERALKDRELRERLADNGRLTVEPIIVSMQEKRHDKQLAGKIMAYAQPAG